MARVFRQQYTQRKPDGVRATRDSAKWYVEYRDAQGIRRRVPGYTDKAATQQLASELERNAERRRAGLVDEFAEHRKRPLAGHLDDWHDALAARGSSRDHANLVKSRVQRALTACGFVYPTDVSASRLQSYLGKLRDDGLSVQTVNFYLQAVKQFCRWLVADRRIPDSPVAYLRGGNVRTDRRHDRRALSTEELRRLLEAARTAPTRYGMPGPERAVLYELAATTGLRAAELRSLTLGAFDLQGDPQTVKVRAAYSKHRRDDTLPLKPSTAQMLARWRDESGPVDPSARLFNVPRKAAKMFRADLDDAGVPYFDADGRVADFHALRHTYITNLARGGVHPKVAQQLARHSTITLTMDRYSHTVVGELVAGLHALPDLSPHPDAERLRATGTDDRLPNCLPLSLPKSLPTRGARAMSRRSSDCTESASGAIVTRSANPTKSGVVCASVRDGSSPCATDLSLRPAGVDPATPGLGNRCSIQLSYERSRVIIVTARSPKPKVRKARRDRGSDDATEEGASGSVRERRNGETVGHRRLSLFAPNSV